MTLKKVDNRTEAQKKRDFEFMNRVDDHLRDWRVKEMLEPNTAIRQGEFRYLEIIPLSARLNAVYGSGASLVKKPVVAAGLTQCGKVLLLVSQLDELKPAASIENFSHCEAAT